MRTPETTMPRDGNRRASDGHQLGRAQRANDTAVPPDVNALLSRLDRVRQFGKGWSARCPAHEDRNASLSIAAGDDGKILAHCFAGCHVSEVLGAIGLQLADLFPRRLADTSPNGRRELREAARQAQWHAALGVLAREATVVSVAAYAVLRRDLTDADAHRVAVAIERIDAAREVLQ